MTTSEPSTTDPRRLDMDWGREETDEGMFTHIRLSDPDTGMVATLSLNHQTATKPQATLIARLSALFIEALQIVGEETAVPGDDPLLSVVDDDD